MIVNRSGEGWEVIYQPAHALLSAQLAARWPADRRPPRWWETLNAVAQHDNGWQEWEVAPRLTEQKHPCNFTETKPWEAIAQWERGIVRGSHQSRWVGLLISRHATALYGARRGELVELDRFLETQRLQQEQWMQELGATPEELAAAYGMVRWTDWLSLVLCWRRLPPGGEAIDAGEGPDGTPYEARLDQEGAVLLSPWPFDSPHFTVEVEARYLDQRFYPDDATLARALAEAGVERLRWELRAAPSGANSGGRSPS